MATSGYYDEIAKVEALRAQRLWRLRRKAAALNAAARTQPDKAPPAPGDRRT